VICPSLETRSAESAEPRESLVEVLASALRAGTSRVGPGLAEGEFSWSEVVIEGPGTRLVLLVALDALGKPFRPSTGDSSTEEKDVEGERRY
jgi:hypothetical protein